MAAVFMVCRRFEVTDRCIQRIPQVFEWHGGPGLRIVFCKPTAGIRKAAAHAVVDFGVKGTVVAAVGEINFPVDYPARVFEQGDGKARQCSRVLAGLRRYFYSRAHAAKPNNRLGPGNSDYYLGQANGRYRRQLVAH